MEKWRQYNHEEPHQLSYRKDSKFVLCRVRATVCAGRLYTVNSKSIRNFFSSSSRPSMVLETVAVKASCYPHGNQQSWE